MSDVVDRPQGDEDAWATACAEDLAAERARRREVSGGSPGSAVEELRRLADAVVDKLSELQSPAARIAAQAVVSQVKAFGGQLRESSPGVLDHLAAAGSELLAAYRAAVSGQEQRWTRGASDPKPPGEKPARADGGSDRDDPDDRDDRPGTERIDLD
jgi:hypothetical protein